MNFLGLNMLNSLLPTIIALSWMGMRGLSML